MGNSLKLSVQTDTWEPNTEELFDYTCDSCQRQDFKVVTVMDLYQSRVSSQMAQDSNGKDSRSVMRIRKEKNSFSLKPMDSARWWFPVGQINSKAANSNSKLLIGDVVRFGRAPYKVTALHLIENDLHTSFKSCDMSLCGDNSRATEPMCRICLSTVVQANDRMLAPCQCSGTMKYIHLFCLADLMRSKQRTNTSEQVLSYYVQDTECELCQDILPQNLLYKGVVYALNDVWNLTRSCLILQSLRNPKERHIISPGTGKAAIVGRGKHSDLSIPDNSLSRSHAKIEHRPDGFYLLDNNSKFGTLKEHTEPLTLTPGSEVTFQTNFSLVRVRYPKPHKVLSLCCSCVLPTHKCRVEDYEDKGGEKMMVSADRVNTEASDPLFRSYCLRE